MMVRMRQIVVCSVFILQLTSLWDFCSSLSSTNNNNNALDSPSTIDEANKPKSRRKRSVIFPTGSDLEFEVSIQIPIAALSATSTTFDMDIPFTYNLPNSTNALYYSGRKLDDDHAAIFELIEDLLNKFGLPGKACILKAICELSESEGLPYNGLLGKAFETLFLLDYGMSSTERLYEYISARQYGEHHGNCNAAYPQCPFSIFSVMDPFEDSSMYPVFMSSNDVNVTEQVYGDKP